MNADQRKLVRAQIQCHPAIIKLRRRLSEAAYQLPEVPESQMEQLVKLQRRFLGGKMPKNVTDFAGGWCVRACISGIVFTASVFMAPGGADNKKVCGPASRLSDAITYYFRDSRLRGALTFNFTIEQAKKDAETLDTLLAELGNLLVECGVPVRGNPAHDARCDIPFDARTEIKLLTSLFDERIGQLEAGLRKLEKQLANQSTVTVVQPEKFPDQTLTLPNIGAPIVWCDTNKL